MYVLNLNEPSKNKLVFAVYVLVATVDLAHLEQVDKKIPTAHVLK